MVEYVNKELPGKGKFYSKKMLEGTNSFWLFPILFNVFS
jgi:hypothetical protein